MRIERYLSKVVRVDMDGSEKRESKLKQIDSGSSQVIRFAHT